MRVILLKDIGGVGKYGEVKDVSDGFARNSLIPRGLAEIATPKTLVSLLARNEHIADKKRLEQTLLEKNLSAVDGGTITISRKANEQGHLFAKIKPNDIIRAVKEFLHVEIPLSAVSPEHIDALGVHTISLSCKGANVKFVLEIRKE